MIYQWMITPMKDFSNIKDELSEREIKEGRYITLTDFVCADCGEGKIYFVKGKETKMVQNNCVCKSLYMTAKNNSLFHKRFAGASFDDFNKEGLKKQYTICRKYAENFDRFSVNGAGLILAGESGLGKTMIAAAIGNYVLKVHRKSVIMQSTSELFELIIKNDFDYDDLTKCNLLILDDIGREKLTEWVKQTFFNIIDIRYRNLRPIICTTNQTSKTLLNHFEADSAILDRILEVCNPVKFTGESYRLRVRKQLKMEGTKI